MKTSRLAQAATAIGLLVSANGARAEGPDPTHVHIRSITHGGTGCPQGTVASHVSDDAETFTLFFDQFVAQIGVGVDVAESYKACNLSIDLEYPDGWQFSIVGVDYRGYAALDSGVVGTQRSEYWLQGISGVRTRLRTDLYGPSADDYYYSDRVAVDALQTWSPCSGGRRALNLKTSVALTSDGWGAGLMTVDSLDGEVMQTYDLVWRSCFR